MWGPSREPTGDLRAVPTRRATETGGEQQSTALPSQPDPAAASADQRGGQCRDRGPLHRTGTGSGADGHGNGCLDPRKEAGAGGRQEPGAHPGPGAPSLRSGFGPLRDGEPPSGSYVQMLRVKWGELLGDTLHGKWSEDSPTVHSLPGLCENVTEPGEQCPGRAAQERGCAQGPGGRSGSCSVPAGAQARRGLVTGVEGFRGGVGRGGHRHTGRGGRCTPPAGANETQFPEVPGPRPSHASRAQKARSPVEAWAERRAQGPCSLPPGSMTGREYWPQGRSGTDPGLRPFPTSGRRAHPGRSAHARDTHGPTAQASRQNGPRAAVRNHHGKT